MNYFFKELGFYNTKPAICDNFSLLNIDGVHYSGKFPAVFFKNVSGFQEGNLKEIAEIRTKVWNYRRVPFFYVLSRTEIRLYDCSQKPFNFNDEDIDINSELKECELDRCKREDKKKLKELSEIFSAKAIDSGVIWLHNKQEYRKKINFRERVDKKLIKALLQTARILKAQEIDSSVIHSILIRSIFIMYLEDKRGIPKKFYLKSNSYLELLDDIKASYEFYEQIEKHFNGDVFPVTELEKKQIKQEHLKIIKQSLSDGEPESVQIKLFNWRLFDFSIIPVQLLSEIYEQFLNEFDLKDKKRRGVFYTPQSLVELILDRVLPGSGNEKDKTERIRKNRCFDRSKK